MVLTIVTAAYGRTDSHSKFRPINIRLERSTYVDTTLADPLKVEIQQYNRLVHAVYAEFKKHKIDLEPEVDLVLRYYDEEFAALKVRASESAAEEPVETPAEDPEEEELELDVDEDGELPEEDEIDEE